MTKKTMRKSLLKNRKLSQRKMVLQVRKHTSKTKKNIKQSITSKNIVNSNIVQSFEEALVNHITNPQKNFPLVDDSAIIFNNVISNLTPTLKQMQFRHGVHMGRMLYTKSIGKKNPIYNLNPTIALVDFLQSIGYTQIIDHSGPHGLVLSIYNAPEFNFGAKAHGREAGIISGFLSAMRSNTVMVDENSCIFEGADRCTFSETNNIIKEKEQQSMEDTISEFCAYMAGRIAKREYGHGHMSMMYNHLLWDSLLHAQYSELIDKFIYYTGMQISKILMNDKYAMGKQQAMGHLSKITSLLNFGELKIKSMRPLDIQLTLDVMSSKQLYINASLSLIRGYIEGCGFDSQVDVSATNHDGAYTLKIKSVHSKKGQRK